MEHNVPAKISVHGKTFSDRSDIVQNGKVEPFDLNAFVVVLLCVCWIQESLKTSQNPNLKSATQYALHHGTV